MVIRATCPKAGEEALGRAEKGELQSQYLPSVRRGAFTARVVVLSQGVGLLPRAGDARTPNPRTERAGAPTPPSSGEVAHRSSTGLPIRTCASEPVRAWCVSALAATL